MIVLDWESGDPTLGRHAAAIFDVGLIGSAIRDSLLSAYTPRVTSLPWSWDNEVARKTHLDSVATCLERLVRQPPGQALVDIVWSAGRGGFAANQEEFREETNAFKAGAALAQRLAELPERPHVRVHLISSAGGLFEAQRNVGPASVPNPLRPYGRAKWEQERTLAGLSQEITRFIYRPSSVYGFGSRGGRSGLIVTLIYSAINNRPARIFGKPETLRDYVFADDIGKFVARKIGDRTAKSACVMLASCKPTSMMETVGMVQRALNKKLLLQFELGGDNTSSNTFSPGVSPMDWKPAALEIGVAQTAMRIRSDFARAHPSQQTMLA